jgi:ABC-type branched-subunit amino acid transport system ATPase component
MAELTRSTTQTTGNASSLGSVVLRAAGLHKQFGGQVVLDGVDLELRRGEVVLLRGGNGTGKTTLLNILTGNLEADAGALDLSLNGRAERFAFPRPWWRNLTTVERFAPELLARRGVGRSWQETRLFSTQSLRDNLVVARPGQEGENPASAMFQRRSVGRQERRLGDEATAVLTELGLGGREQSSGDKVSLGQSKRVAIARAVQAGARVLFLDEPLAGLDGLGVADVVAMLRELAEKDQLTLVIVEHVFNIPQILAFASTVWTLADGQLTVEQPEHVRAQVRNAIGEGLQTWMRQVAGGDDRIVHEPLPGGAVLSRLRPAAQSRPESASAPAFEVQDVTVRRGDRVVLGEIDQAGRCRNGLSFSLNRGEICVLQAPNGWGKTTLLEAAAGLLPVAGGTLRLGGRDVTRAPAWTRRNAGLSFLRTRDHVFPGLRVEEMLTLAGVSEAPPEVRSLVGRKAGDLSGGEKQELAMACALGGETVQVALIDEPFSALDVDAVRAAWELLAHKLGDCAVLISVPGSLPPGSIPSGGNDI